MSNSNSGVFYVAAGKKYIDEACDSARSLKKINPSIKISLEWFNILRDNIS